jgi:hypothetical protein
MLVLLSLTACTTNKIDEPICEPVIVEIPVEYKLDIQPPKPDPPTLEELTWLYIKELELFAITPEDMETNSRNLEELRVYIERLQEGWKTYEKSTSNDKTS